MTLEFHYPSGWIDIYRWTTPRGRPVASDGTAGVWAFVYREHTEERRERDRNAEAPR